MLWGRERDLERLRAELARTGFVAVHGPFGVGKTAVVRVLAAEHGRARIGQSLPALSGTAYHPLLHATAASAQPGEPHAATAAFRAALTNDDLLVLEDLHWSDGATLEVLVELRGHCPIVVTVQDGSPGSDRVLRLVESLGGSPVALGPLESDTIEQLIGALHPDLLDGERRRIADRSAGNPLVASLLVEAGDLAVPHARGVGRAAVTALVERLSGPARRSLAVLAHVAEPVSADALSDVEQLLAAGLVDRGHDDRLQLRHHIVGSVAAARLPDAERAEMFARLATFEDLPPVTRAEFLLEAGDDSAALEQGLAASYRPVPRAEQAAALFVAARAAVRLRALGSSGAPPAADADQLVVAAAGALNDSIRFDEAATLIDDPSTFGDEHQMPAAIEALRTALGRGARPAARRILDQIEPIVARHEGPDVVRARAMRSVLLGWDDGVEDLHTLAREQIEIARSGAERSHAAMLALASYRRGLDHVADMQSWLAVAKEEAARDGSLATELLAARNLMMVQVGVGAHEAARELGSELIAKAEAAGEQVWVIELRTLQLLSEFHDGTGFDEVLSWMSYVRTAPVRLETRALATIALATLLADRGQAARSAEVLAPWMEPDALVGFDLLSTGMIVWAATQRAWVLGDLPEAIRAARWATDHLPAGFPSLAGMQVVWRWAEFESGLPITAPAPAGGLLDSAKVEAEAIDLLIAGRHLDAAERFLAAAESWRPVLMRCALRCRWGAGLSFARGGRTVEALELLDDLDADLDRCWAPALRPRVTAARRMARGSSLGAARSATGPGDAGAGTVATAQAVTPRERAVLVLVAEGLTSAEVARRLGVSVATVNTHIQSAKRKLGARTRIEAAARVAQG